MNFNSLSGSDRGREEELTEQRCHRYPHGGTGQAQQGTRISLSVSDQGFFPGPERTFFLHLSGFASLIMIQVYYSS